MKRATVVIGANYGDEGKGLMVDYFAAQQPGDTVVVRFNGGAQAGHTVVTPAGRRHVFSHFSSGTFAGARTYLAKHFVCNPLLFWKEANMLPASVTDRLPGLMAADPRCFVSTPYDILINQALEEKRGTDRHGSVGVGFGETIERNNYPSFQLWKSDLADRDKVRAKLRIIRDRWLPTRCRQLGIRPLAGDDHRLSDDMLNHIAEQFDLFESSVATAGAEFLDGKAVVFEGAQGLCLDMDGPNFPHVTRSNTGLKNVLPIARAASLRPHVVYVTRTYLTKHGAGPLPGECAPTPEMVDETNTPHPFQGTLRYAPLNTHQLLARIATDRKMAPDLEWSIALTCTDQIASDRAVQIASELKSVRFVSAGPRRDCVSAVE